MGKISLIREGAGRRPPSAKEPLSRGRKKKKKKKRTRELERKKVTKVGSVGGTLRFAGVGQGEKGKSGEEKREGSHGGEKSHRKEGGTFEMNTSLKRFPGSIGCKTAEQEGRN